MTDGVTGAADSANETTMADGAGKTPIAPITNCGIDERPHVNLQ